MTTNTAVGSRGASPSDHAREEFKTAVGDAAYDESTSTLIDFHKNWGNLDLLVWRTAVEFPLEELDDRDLIELVRWSRDGDTGGGGIVGRAVSYGYDLAESLSQTDRFL